MTYLFKITTPFDVRYTTIEDCHWSLDDDGNITDLVFYSNNTSHFFNTISVELITIDQMRGEVPAGKSTAQMSFLESLTPPILKSSS